MIGRSYSMCGIYGFARITSQPAPLVELARIASMASSRGQDACGAAAWLNESLAVRRALGPFCMHPEIIEGLDQAVSVIGNARLATTGTFDLSDAQPVTCGQIAVVHNGVIPGHHQIARYRHLSLATNCDSEILATLIHGESGDPCSRLSNAVSVIPSETPYAVLAIIDGALWVACRKMPLYSQTTPTGIYFSSRKPCFMGCDPVPDGVWAAERFVSKNLRAETIRVAAV
jgi:glucosamine--fructose-6-phosphate aminotransferase (isomerizing)